MNRRPASFQLDAGLALFPRLAHYCCYEQNAVTPLDSTFWFHLGCPAPLLADLRNVPVLMQAKHSGNTIILLQASIVLLKSELT